MIGSDILGIHHEVCGDILVHNYSHVKLLGTQKDRDTEGTSWALIATRKHDMSDGPLKVHVIYNPHTQIVSVSAQGYSGRQIHRQYHVYADVIDMCYDTTTNLL